MSGIRSRIVRWIGIAGRGDVRGPWYDYGLANAQLGTDDGDKCDGENGGRNIGDIGNDRLCRNLYSDKATAAGFTRNFSWTSH